MAATNYITDRAQQAMREVLVDSEPTAIAVGQIYAGIDPLTGGQKASGRILPCVDVICQEAEQDPPAPEAFCGNWACVMQVQVRSNASDTTQSTHHEQAREIFDLVSHQDILSSLDDALIDFHAYGTRDWRQSWEIVDDSWVSTISFTLLCCGSEIT